jgi:hypothetical protein
MKLLEDLYFAWWFADQTNAKAEKLIGDYYGKK